MAAYIFMENQRRRQIRRERVFRDRNNVLDCLNDAELISRYRFPRETILKLIDLVEADVAPSTERSHAIPANIQVLTSLRIMAKGDFLSEATDLHGISKASGSIIFHKVVNAINKNLQNISFPSDHATVQSTKEKFYKLAKFPNVIGTIDGTQIPIQGMSADDEYIFVCRKGFHSINVQAVTDADMRFINVVTKFPGSTHDAFILSRSGLPHILSDFSEGGFLLGDSGYPLREYLLTPLANPRTEQEQRYNRAHIRTRNIIERAFGVLKSRFRCIHKTGGALPYKPEKAVKIIECVFRLHNLAIDQGVPLLEEPLEQAEDTQEPDSDGQPASLRAVEVRNQIVQRF